MLKNGLAIVYKETGKIDRARALLEEIVSEDPSSQSAKDNLNAILTVHELR